MGVGWKKGVRKRHYVEGSTGVRLEKRVRKQHYVEGSSGVRPEISSQELTLH